VGGRAVVRVVSSSPCSDRQRSPIGITPKRSRVGERSFSFLSLRPLFFPSPPSLPPLSLPPRPLRFVLSHSNVEPAPDQLATCQFAAWTAGWTGDDEGVQFGSSLFPFSSFSFFLLVFLFLHSICGPASKSSSGGGKGRPAARFPLPPPSLFSLFFVPPPHAGWAARDVGFFQSTQRLDRRLGHGSALPPPFPSSFLSPLSPSFCPSRNSIFRALVLYRFRRRHNEALLIDLFPLPSPFSPLPLFFPPLSASFFCAAL